MDRRWHSEFPAIKLHSTAADFMVHKIPLMMIKGGIILKSVSSRDPLISFLEMVDHSMR